MPLAALPSVSSHLRIALPVLLVSYGSPLQRLLLMGACRLAVNAFDTVAIRGHDGPRDEVNYAANDGPANEQLAPTNLVDDGKNTSSGD